jgi:putative intracellular protease/amidase
LPGGTVWEVGGNMEIIPLLDKVIEANNLVAAICAATVFLGQHGYLNTIKHTSNHIYFLKQSGGKYKGEDWYINKPCVSDKNLITANGTAMVDFAASVFSALNVLEGNKALNFWLQFFPKSTMPGVSIEDFVIDPTH